MNDERKLPHERACAMGVAVLTSGLAQRIGPLDIAQHTAARERVEDAVVDAMGRVEPELVQGWSVEDAREQAALHAVMEMLFSELHPAPGG